jgi:hypothetical protein
VERAVDRLTKDVSVRIRSPTRRREVIEAGTSEEIAIPWPRQHCRSGAVHSGGADDRPRQREQQRDLVLRAGSAPATDQLR